MTDGSSSRYGSPGQPLERRGAVLGEGQVFVVGVAGVQMVSGLAVALLQLRNELARGLRRFGGWTQELPARTAVAARVV